MNRVDPLREGSGERNALTVLDGGALSEFHGYSEKISFQIISLLNKLYHLRHTPGVALPKADSRRGK